MVDIWDIKPDQRAYYLEQYKNIQGSSQLPLTLSQVEEFFALSQLEESDLRKIFRLSDFNNDNIFTFPEFTVAMHLGVLRKNGVEIPDLLPDSLRLIDEAQNLSSQSEFNPFHLQPDDRILQNSLRNRTWSASQNDFLATNFDQTANKESLVYEKKSRPNHTLHSRAFSSGCDGIIFDDKLGYTHSTLKKEHFLKSNDEMNKKVPPAPPPRRGPSNATITNENYPNSDINYKFSNDQSEIFMKPSSRLHHRIKEIKSSCDQFVSDNEQLGLELMRLQQQRIALEILLEHLTPLDQII